MSYYSQWLAIMNNAGTSPETEALIKKYYELETNAYDLILQAGDSSWCGTVSDLANHLGFGAEIVIFLGFLDGINSSLKTSLDLEPVTETSELALDIDFQRLYRQMHEAKADWLYKLDAWNQVLAPEDQEKITRDYRTSKIVHREKIGRNDPCPCGSGKKYKNCCGKGA
jgi:hypothetical protein